MSDLVKIEALASENSRALLLLAVAYFRCKSRQERLTQSVCPELAATCWLLSWLEMSLSHKGCHGIRAVAGGASERLVWPAVVATLPPPTPPSVTTGSTRLQL